MVIREVFGNMKLHGTDKSLDIFNMTLMILILIVIGYPFLNVLSLSFSSENYILSGQVNLLPKGFTLSAYKTIINHPSFLGGYLTPPGVTPTLSPPRETPKKKIAGSSPPP